MDGIFRMEERDWTGQRSSPPALQRQVLWQALR
nr:MAG TPA: hypothetical protein [Caudoviricetes sp.]